MTTQDIPDDLAYTTAYKWAIDLECYSSKAKKNKKDALELLNRVLDKKVRKDLEELQNVDRGILIVSQDEELIDGVASYIFWRHLDYHGFFYSENFIGHDKSSIEQRLFSTDDELLKSIELYKQDNRYLDLLMKKIASNKHDLFQYFLLGGTLLLKNIKEDDTLNRIAGIVKETCVNIDSPPNDSFARDFIASRKRAWIVLNNCEDIDNPTDEEEEKALSHIKDDRCFWSSHAGRVIASVNNKSDIPEYVKKRFKIIELGNEKENLNTGQCLNPIEKDEKTKDYVFKKLENNHWKIVFNGNDLGPIDDMIGFVYINYLLLNHGEEFRPHQLNQLIKNLGLPTSSSSKMDKQTAEELETVLKLLEEKEESATNIDNIENYEDQISEIKKELKNRKAQFIDPNTKKMNDAVRKAIKASLEKIKKLDIDETLYSHLDDCLKRTNNVYCYRPGTALDWQL